MEFIPKK